MASPSAVAHAIVVPAGLQPDGYQEVPGSPDAILDADHVGAVGSQFTQDCDDVPVEVPPGGVAWHFVLPQRSVANDDIFAAMTIVFQTTGTQTLTTFGPPNAAHAWVVTAGDDVLLGAAADVYSTDPVAWSEAEETTFDLLHVCSTSTATTAPTTSTSTTTAASTSTSTSTSTTTAASTSTSTSTSTTSTTMAIAVGTTTTAVVSPASITPGGVTTPATSVDPGATAGHMATTGRSGRALWLGIALIGAGVVAVAYGRRHPTSP